MKPDVDALRQALAGLGYKVVMVLDHKPQGRNRQPEALESNMRSSAFSILAVALLLTACGTEQADPELETAAAPSTLHVRATGMVKSLGIT